MKIEQQHSIEITIREVSVFEAEPSGLSPSFTDELIDVVSDVIQIGLDANDTAGRLIDLIQGLVEDGS